MQAKKREEKIKTFINTHTHTKKSTEGKMSTKTISWYFLPSKFRLF